MEKRMVVEMMLMTTTHVGHDDRRYLLLICFFVRSCKPYCIDLKGLLSEVGRQGDLT